MASVRQQTETRSLITCSVWAQMHWTRGHISIQKTCTYKICRFQVHILCHKLISSTKSVSWISHRWSWSSHFHKHLTWLPFLFFFFFFSVFTLLGVSRDFIGQAWKQKGRFQWFTHLCFNNNYESCNQCFNEIGLAASPVSFYFL